MPRVVCLAEIETGSDPACEARVRKDLGDALFDMARAFQEANYNERIDEIKHRLRVRLTAKRGVQREMECSQWFTEMRVRLNKELSAWESSPNGKAVGSARPFPKLWIEEIFGEDWNRMKRERLPPQRSRNALERGLARQRRGRGGGRR
jgi:hypothetical protein